MAETIADVRKRSWQTRREKYGKHGHSGAYRHPQAVYTAPWNERLRTMQDALIRLYRDGVLSEGQVSKATGLDRVSCRDLAIQLPAPPVPKPDLLPLTPEPFGEWGISWSRADIEGRRDFIGVRIRSDGTKEYLTHNEALCNPYSLTIEVHLTPEGSDGKELK